LSGWSLFLHQGGGKQAITMLCVYPEKQLTKDELIVSSNKQEEKMSGKTSDAGAWYNVLGAAMQIPGAKVDRKEFLAKEFEKYCNRETIEKIINESTVKAGVEVTLMDKVAEDMINFHSGLATAISFAAGIPGGLTVLATVPVDIAQYYYHVIVVAQKLAYIYGFSEIGLVDDYFKSLVTLLIGVMVNIDEADKTVTEIYSAQVSKEAMAITLGKALNKGMLRIAAALSYRLTGKTVFKSIWKVIPIIGGVVSGRITLFTFLPMCNNLKARLHKSTETVTKELSKRVLR
jgi:hypothetical protein